MGSVVWAAAMAGRAGCTLGAAAEAAEPQMSPGHEELQSAGQLLAAKFLFHLCSIPALCSALCLMGGREDSRVCVARSGRLRSHEQSFSTCSTQPDTCT